MTPLTCAWPPSLPAVPTSRATRVTSEVNTESCSIMRVDELGRAQELAFQRTPVHFQHHRLAQVALGHGADGAGHFRRRPGQVGDERVDGLDFIRPAARHARHRHALLEPAFLADHAADARGFAGAPFAGAQQVVEGVGDLAVDARPLGRQALGEVPIAEGQHAQEDLLQGVAIQPDGLWSRESVWPAAAVG